MATNKLPSLVGLGERGDLTAAPGSLQWAIAVRLELQACLHDTERYKNHLTWLYKTMQENEGYKQLTNEDGTPFASWRGFCVARQPYGLGYDPQAIERIVQESKKTPQELAQEVTPLGERGNHTGNNQYQKQEETLGPKVSYGASAEYTTARIKRDRPDIAEKMQRGEYSSVEQAARDAGIRKAYWKIPRDDPSGVAQAIIRNFSRDDIEEIIAQLENHLA